MAESAENAVAHVTAMLAKQLKAALSPKQTLLLPLSQSSVFSGFAGQADRIALFGPKALDAQGQTGTTILGSLDDIESTDGTYDYIVGDFPLGLAKAKSTGKPSLLKARYRQNWAMIFLSLLRLSDRGSALFLIEPALSMPDWIGFVQEL